MADIVLSAKNLSRTLEGDIPVTLVRDASLEVGKGEFITITGPSGSGKSSLLYLLGLLDRPTQGVIQLNGRNASGLGDDEQAQLRLENIGFIFQSHFLLHEFTALENVMIPMRRLGRLPQQQARARALSLLADLDLAEHAGKRPRQLSGGQSQRVAIARALANDPLLILADEPTGNLDSVSSAAVQTILRELARKHGRSVVTVTHDPAFAQTSDRNIHIVDGKIFKD